MVMVAFFFFFFLVYCVFLSLNPVHLKEKLQALSSKQGLVTVKGRLPGVPLVLGCSLCEPVDAGLHAAHGVSPVQEVGDVSVFQSLVPPGPLRVRQSWG